MRFWDDIPCEAGFDSWDDLKAAADRRAEELTAELEAEREERDARFSAEREMELMEVGQVLGRSLIMKPTTKAHEGRNGTDNKLDVALMLKLGQKMARSLDLKPVIVALDGEDGREEKIYLTWENEESGEKVKEEVIVKEEAVVEEETAIKEEVVAKEEIIVKEETVEEPMLGEIRKRKGPTGKDRTKSLRKSRRLGQTRTTPRRRRLDSDPDTKYSRIGRPVRQVRRKNKAAY